MGEFVKAKVVTRRQRCLFLSNGVVLSLQSLKSKLDAAGCSLKERAPSGREEKLTCMSILFYLAAAAASTGTQNNLEGGGGERKAADWRRQVYYSRTNAPR